MTDKTPWNLTKREQEALDGWAIHGTQTKAAEVLGINRASASMLIMRATHKMGAEHGVQALLMWDRFVMGRELT